MAGLTNKDKIRDMKLLIEEYKNSIAKCEMATQKNHERKAKIELDAMDFIFKLGGTLKVNKPFLADTMQTMISDLDRANEQLNVAYTTMSAPIKDYRYADMIDDYDKELEKIKAEKIAVDISLEQLKKKVEDEFSQLQNISQYID